MPVSMTKADDWTSDPEGPWSRLCQVSKALYCGCTGFLRKLQRAFLSLLGALHIITGMLIIGVEVYIRVSKPVAWDFEERVFPFWFGAFFILIGIMCIVSHICGNSCVVFISGILNLAGVAFASVAISLYRDSAEEINFGLFCRGFFCEFFYGMTPTEEDLLKHSEYVDAQEETLVPLKNLVNWLIILSALELCVSIISAIFGIIFLRIKKKEENKSFDKLDLYEPAVMRDVTCIAA